MASVTLALLLLAAAGTTRATNSGVFLRSETLNTQLPNNSLISSEAIGSINGAIICSRASRDRPDSAEWTNATGQPVPEGHTGVAGNLVLYTQLREDGIHLFKGEVEFSTQHEGIYSCHIDDDGGNAQVLHIGIYSPATLQNSGVPVVGSPVFSLLTDPTTHSSQFTLTCPSSSFPPLSTFWSRNGLLLTPTVEQFQTSQVLVDASESRYYNILRVNGNMVGDYMCLVGSSAGNASASIVVQAPSGPPLNVRAKPGGGGSVLVTWTPPTGGVNGYVIVYGPTNAADTETLSVRVDDSAATTHTIEGIATEREYTVHMWAFLDLPSSLSNSDTVFLDVPGQPSSVVATPTSSSTAVFQWEGPQIGANVDGYVVLYAPTELCEGMVGGEVEVSGSENTRLEVSGMEAGARYLVRVAAFNSIGTGEFSSPPATLTITEEAPAGAPLNVSVIAVPPDSLSVSWEPPDCLLWNSPLITSYTIHLLSLSLSQPSEAEETVEEGLEYELTGLASFIEYSVSVSASNGQGRGPLSQPVAATLITAPGPLQSVNYEPDILSVLLTWEPPLRGRGYITMVTLEHYNSGGVKLGTESVVGSSTSYRLGGLLPVSTYTVSLTPHTSDPAPGPAHNLTISTSAIGSVTSVKVTVFNSTAVNVSWTPLPSLDITSYTVYYSRVAESDGKGDGVTTATTGGGSGSEMFVVFHVEKSLWRGESGEGWGLVGGLEEGVEYMFSVVAVVMVGGEVRLQGEKTQPITAALEDTKATDGGGLDAVIVISAAAGGLLLLLTVVGIIVLIAIAWIYRRYRRSGKMEVASAVLELRPHPMTHPQVAGAYDPPSDNLASCRPEVVDAPTDIIAVEGERVDFKLKVLGSPEPTVVWYHNGCMVGPDYATEIANDGGLTLVSVEPNHEGTYRYTVSNSVGSIQGKVTLYVTSEMSGWGQQQDRRKMGLPTVTSDLVAVEQFPQFVREKSENGSKGLRDQFLCLSSCGEKHMTSVALSNDNKKYNRFANIVPYDDNRVKLKPLSGREDCQHDYINASYIDGYGIAKKFVATQGPTDATVVDFWRMVWQLHSPTVVMMTDLEEGRRKCEQYWPTFGTADYGPYSVTLAEQKIRADFTIRKLTLTSTFSTRRVHYVTHYQFTSWRDHQVPGTAFPLLEFHRRLTENHRPNKGPIIVHCSAGVGRTGAFILLDTALGQAAGERRMDIPDILTRLRSQRTKMVQTPEQYTFVHKAVLEKLTCRPTRMEVAQLDATLAELQTHDPRLGHSQLEEQFHQLEQLSPRPEQETMCRTALQHPHKNRSRDYLPSDQWRVSLKDERPNYIHACFACDHRQKEAFIIAQAPLEGTCRDFWKMVHERQCGAIVMLSGPVEEGMVVCQRYWPTTDVELYGEYIITRLEEQKRDSYVERVLSITDSKTGHVHYVSQFQVMGWNSDGAVSNPAAVVSCMLEVEAVKRRSGDNPIVVHCSDGVTRSGIFCAAMTAIDCCQLEDTVDVFQVVRALRQQRPGAVPQFQHYRLLHKLLLVFRKTSYSITNC